jgi:hypothetical protein
MSTAKHDDTDLLAGTSFANPGARQLADRGSLADVRAARQRIEAPLRPNPPAAPPATTTEGPVKEGQIHVDKTTRGVIVRIKAQKVGPIPSLGFKVLRPGSHGAPTKGEVFELRHWLLTWHSKADLQVLKIVGRANRDVMRHYITLHARLGQLCTEVLDLYDTKPASHWPLVDVVREIRATDVSPTRLALTPSQVGTATDRVNRQIRALSTLLQSVETVSKPSAKTLSALIKSLGLEAKPGHTKYAQPVKKPSYDFGIEISAERPVEDPVDFPSKYPYPSKRHDPSTDPHRQTH